MQEATCAFNRVLQARLIASAAKLDLPLFPFGGNWNIDARPVVSAHMGRGRRKLWLSCGTSPRTIAENKSLNIPVKCRGRLIGDADDRKRTSRFVFSKPIKIELHWRSRRGAKPPNENRTQEQGGKRHHDEFSMRAHVPPNDKSSATRHTGRVDCNRSARAGFAAAHG